ncbi:hypothetical protein F4821DRAFT_229990 [Hypoxylon rubiginosum]|uniref:Uncharacterized protein n=1 Tax=Hypoxylon rubiginosum TaxID=110542 RepID=A0ACC0DBY2_9PEZI|nr:hypothetical protein F4821DRAFT_229990 [Hypoxylon rubiginosum]
MKSFAILMGAALVATSASAQRAIVKTNCPAPVVFVESFPNEGIGAPPAALTPNTTWSEDLHPSGSTIKIDTGSDLAHPLVFDYFFSADSEYIFYELSSELGNPFGKTHVVLTPDAGCVAFDCAAFDPGCYSRTEAKKVYGCPQPVDLTLTLCA